MRSFWFILTAMIALQAHAEDLCGKAMTTVEINKCGQANHQKSDKKLNAAYQAALHHIEGLDDPQQRKDTKQGLIEAQRLWVQFRDKDCGAIYDLWRDGTIRGAMYWGCMTGHTETRTKDLESFADEH
jgi:uncharacterized protein YecT (DUF1311 family)